VEASSRACGRPAAGNVSGTSRISARRRRWSGRGVAVQAVSARLASRRLRPDRVPTAVGVVNRLSTARRDTSTCASACHLDAEPSCNHERVGDVAVLDRRVYVMADVDLYLGLPAGTARRWIDGYQRGGRSYPPVIRPEHSGHESVTWGEFVETSLLSRYRSRGVSLQRLRPAVQRLRVEFDSHYPLASAAPYLDVSGRELVRRVQDETGVEPPLQLMRPASDRRVGGLR